MHNCFYFPLIIFYIFQYCHHNVLLNNELLLDIIDLQNFRRVCDDITLMLNRHLIFMKYDKLIDIIMRILGLLMTLLWPLHIYTIRINIRLYKYDILYHILVFSLIDCRYQLIFNTLLNGIVNMLPKGGNLIKIKIFPILTYLMHLPNHFMLKIL